MRQFCLFTAYNVLADIGFFNKLDLNGSIIGT